MQAMKECPAPEVEHLEEAVALIRNFADGLHHAKEESLLFPLMAERGFSVTQGPVAVMLQEHTIGRAFVRGIDENIQLFKEGDLSALNLIYSNMNGYSELLQNHIYKENTMLFRMADNALSQSDQDSLSTQFEKIDIQSTNNNSKSDYLARISNLEHVYMHA